jgi:DNA-directed RNA polymerase beta subunit
MILTPQEAQEKTRAFFDPEKLRSWVTESVKSAFEKKLNSLETDQYKLVVKNMNFDDPNKKFSFKEQKQAILEKRDLVLPLRAEFQLVDKKTDEVIDKKKTLVANVPYVTERNTVILNGSEYLPINQQRLKAGIFTRVKETGEAEAHVNVIPGTGMGGRVVFHPDKGIFVYVVQSTQIKLYGLLRDLGVPEADMERAWGKELLLRNKQAYEGNELDKLYAKIFERR